MQQHLPPQTRASGALLAPSHAAILDTGLRVYAAHQKLPFDFLRTRAACLVPPLLQVPDLIDVAWDALSGDDRALSRLEDLLVVLAPPGDLDDETWLRAAEKKLGKRREHHHDPDGPLPANRIVPVMLATARLSAELPDRRLLVSLAAQLRGLGRVAALTRAADAVARGEPGSDVQMKVLLDVAGHRCGDPFEAPSLDFPVDPRVETWHCLIEGVRHFRSRPLPFSRGPRVVLPLVCAGERLYFDGSTLRPEAPATTVNLPLVGGGGIDVDLHEESTGRQYLVMPPYVACQTLRLEAHDTAVVVCGQTLEAAGFRRVNATLHGSTPYFEYHLVGERPAVRRAAPGDVLPITWRVCPHTDSTVDVRVTHGTETILERLGMPYTGRVTFTVPAGDPDETWVELTVHGRCVTEPLVRRMAVLTGDPFPLEAWLAARPRIARAIVFEEPDNSIRDFTDWTPDEKRELADLVDALRRGGSPNLPEVPPNLADPVIAVTRLDRPWAWRYHLAFVAWSLRVEIDGAVGWSIADYADEWLAMLLDSRWMFPFATWFLRLAPSYEIFKVVGTGTPGDPARVFGWLAAGSHLAPTRRETIARLLEWCRILTHHTGPTTPQNYAAHWMYSGGPPVERILRGMQRVNDDFERIAHYTAGCGGTTALLNFVLRTANIPVGNEPMCSHHKPSFPTEGPYLSHGDDPYSFLLRRSDIPADELFIDRETLLAWFGPGVPNCDLNVGRRVDELVLQYLPRELLRRYCRDEGAGLGHAEGEVFASFSPGLFTVAELEAQGLWDRLAARVAELGGCGSIL